MKRSNVVWDYIYRYITNYIYDSYNIIRIITNLQTSISIKPFYFDDRSLIIPLE